jgi:hypothetical protein
VHAPTCKHGMGSEGGTSQRPRQGVEIYWSGRLQVVSPPPLLQDAYKRSMLDLLFVSTVGCHGHGYGGMGSEG